MAYASYDDYSGTWHGDMPEAEFEKWAARASIEIDRLTTGRAADAPAYMARALALCCCALADALQRQDSTALATQGGAIAAESVDGYSVTWRDGADSGGMAAAADAALLAICRKYLCWPVNLMYTGVQP